MKGLAVIGLLMIALMALISCQNEQQIEYGRYYSAGAAVYQAHCQNCHGDKGQGLAALIPPLTDSVFLKANKHRLPCYLQSGLKGKIVIHNKEFEGQMPAANLSPIEIAQVLTYINNSFGNQSGLTDNDDVVADLRGCN